MWLWGLTFLGAHDKNSKGGGKARGDNGLQFHGPSPVTGGLLTMPVSSTLGVTRVTRTLHLRQISAPAAAAAAPRPTAGWRGRPASGRPAGQPEQAQQPGRKPLPVGAVGGHALDEVDPLQAGLDGLDACGQAADQSKRTEISIKGLSPAPKRSIAARCAFSSP